MPKIRQNLKCENYYSTWINQYREEIYSLSKLEHLIYLATNSFHNQQWNYDPDSNQMFVSTNKQYPWKGSFVLLKGVQHIHLHLICLTRAFLRICDVLRKYYFKINRFVGEVNKILQKFSQKFHSFSNCYQAVFLTLSL